MDTETVLEDRKPAKAQKGTALSQSMKPRKGRPKNSKKAELAKSTHQDKPSKIKAEKLLAKAEPNSSAQSTAEVHGQARERRSVVCDAQAIF